MKRIVRLVKEIQRRSLWQILAIYIAASWGIVQFIDSLVSVLGLPPWSARLALFLLIIGLPVVLATAFIQEGKAPEAQGDVASPAPHSETPRGTAYRLFTWRNAIGGGVVAFALFGVVAAGWMMTHRGGPKEMRIAVLPFENQGSSDDAYFADGVADEVRTKLAAIPGLQVTARASATPYAKTTKAPKEIGRELGVDYLLTATVNWSKNAGNNRVRVHPELVKVADEATVWTETIEKELSDVFTMQTDIATKVAEKLNIALAGRAKERVETRPTENLDAWDAYLRGEEVTESLGLMDAPTLRRARPYYLRAIELDSAFADAWSRFAAVEAELTRLAPDPAAVERVKHAAERALALAPDRAAGRRAMGLYLRQFEMDKTGALEQYREGLKYEPNNVELLDGVARVERANGEFENALAHLQQSRELNPRSVATNRTLMSAYQDVGDFQKALQLGQSTLEISPKNLAIIQMMSTQYALLGQLDSARAVVKAALARGVDTTQLIARYALIQESMWMLPPELLPRITKLTPADFDGNRGQWALKVGATWRLLGDTKRQHAYGDSAVTAHAAQLKNFPDDAELHELYGRSLALAGRTREAIDEAELSEKMRAAKLDATTGPYVRFQVVRILIQAGEYDRAIDRLEGVLNEKGHLITRQYLRIDPSFAALRGNPRFEKLVAPAV